MFVEAKGRSAFPKEIKTLNKILVGWLVVFYGKSICREQINKFKKSKLN